MSLKHRDEGQAGELTALIGIEDLRRLVLMQGLFLAYFYI